MNTKPEIRKAMLERRQQMPEEESRAASQRICEQLAAISLPAHSVIAGYKAIKGEASVQAALLTFHDRKYRLCLPSVQVPEKVMGFKSWRPKMPMKKGAHGTFEPDTTEVVTPTVVWVPLVAFDRTGHRLGYGSGYYDATLTYLKKSNPTLRTFGIAFASQEVEALPREGHDMRLDYIVTEREVITL